MNIKKTSGTCRKGPNLGPTLNWKQRMKTSQIGFNFEEIKRRGLKFLNILIFFTSNHKTGRKKWSHDLDIISF